jgi:hypothetical protein
MPEGFRLLADSFDSTWEPDAAIPIMTVDEDIAGSKQSRSFLVEVDHTAHDSLNHLSLIKDQPWDNGPPSDSFDVLVKVSPPLSGVQMPEHELALTG